MSRPIEYNGKSPLKKREGTTDNKAMDIQKGVEKQKEADILFFFNTGPISHDI